MRNTYAICPVQEDSSPKGELILRNIIEWHHLMIKAEAVQDEHAHD